jgi:hypothetical protein
MRRAGSWWPIQEFEASARSVVATDPKNAVVTLARYIGRTGNGIGSSAVWECDAPTGKAAGLEPWVDKKICCHPAPLDPSPRPTRASLALANVTAALIDLQLCMLENVMRITKGRFFYATGEPIPRSPTKLDRPKLCAAIERKPAARTCFRFLRRVCPTRCCRIHRKQSGWPASAPIQKFPGSRPA